MFALLVIAVNECNSRNSGGARRQCRGVLRIDSIGLDWVGNQFRCPCRCPLFSHSMTMPCRVGPRPPATATAGFESPSSVALSGDPARDCERPADGAGQPPEALLPTTVAENGETAKCREQDRDDEAVAPRRNQQGPIRRDPKIPPEPWESPCQTVRNGVAAPCSERRPQQGEPVANVHRLARRNRDVGFRHVRE